jgi:DNA-binding LacI/PurR family transcriptional regulator
VGRLAAEGHRRIGLVVKSPERGESSHYMAANEMIEGCREALGTAGIAFERRLVAEVALGDEVAVDCREEVGGLLDAADGPTALIAGTSPLLAGAIEAVRERGLRIPEDVSVAGVADESFDPRVTIASVSTKLIGEAAAERLIRIIGGESLNDRKLVMETHLRRGDSTGRAPDTEQGR